jgi:hypothetical protein
MAIFNSYFDITRGYTWSEYLTGRNINTWANRASPSCGQSVTSALGMAIESMGFPMEGYGSKFATQILTKYG